MQYKSYYILNYFFKKYSTKSKLKTIRKLGQDLGIVGKPLVSGIS
jgi:hypothetical protein